MTSAPIVEKIAAPTRFRHQHYLMLLRLVTRSRLSRTQRNLTSRLLPRPLANGTDIEIFTWLDDYSPLRTVGHHPPTRHRISDVDSFRTTQTQASRPPR